ncbi:hypothetical protein DS745_06810 [Anaerobacillus alkaliphilus]|uniref:Uncharacterized protein n=1 Tax=Anaerobacillus alkaliphilus TaxID=1548597 RepID=A0A4Q0VW50_9BACI|nr:hypothetical protein [Anaerobacillus alkaliphilus]RXJ02409.1 hypothetical protein DS745_06810 [Anaerobacillus alkaliphilus]
MSTNNGGVLDILRKLAPGAPVAEIYLRGKKVPLVNYVTMTGDLVFFNGPNCEVCVFEVADINGVCFLPVEAD